MTRSSLSLVVFFLVICVLNGVAFSQTKLGPQLLERLESLKRGSTFDSRPTVVWVSFAEKEAVEGQKRAVLLSMAAQSLSSAARVRRQRRGTLPNRSIVTMDDVPIPSEYIHAIELIPDLKIRVKSKWLNAVSVQVGNPRAIDELASLKFVTSIELIPPSPPREPIEESDIEMEIEEEPPQSTLDSEKRQYIKWDYGRDMRQLIGSLNINGVHDLGYTGMGITVLVLDSGFVTKHEVFSNLTIVDSYDFVHDDENVADEAGEADHGSHGTSVLGLIVGQKQGTYVGVAPHAQVLLAKTEAMTYEERIEEDFFIAGLEWGESLGADVATSSLGYHRWWTFKDYNGVTSPASRALDMAVDRGVTVLMAIGNYGTASLTTPADAAKAIAVGATSELNDQNLAGFSSVGPTSDGRIKPEVVGPGESIPVISYTKYKRNSGTSFSTPIVAGIVALLLQGHPDWTPRHVREALLRTASRSSNPSVTFGWGYVDAFAAFYYNPKVGKDKCVHGVWDESMQVCRCNPGYYNANCDTRVMKCSSYCKRQGVCYQERCICTSDGSDKRCFAETIPGWICKTKEYNDGKVCNFECGIPDPDCGKYKLEDCQLRGSTWTEIENLKTLCVSPEPSPSPSRPQSPPNPPAGSNGQPLNLPELNPGDSYFSRAFGGTSGILVFIIFAVLFAGLCVYLLFKRRARTRLT